MSVESFMDSHRYYRKHHLSLYQLLLQIYICQRSNMVNIGLHTFSDIDQ